MGFRATGNQGGPGHHWVKRRYIDPAPNVNKIIVDAKTGLKRVFIPSKVGDNKFLDAQYIQQLKASARLAVFRARPSYPLAPDVILAHGAVTVGPLLQATRTVPIVFPVAGDPVAAGLVDSLARPGGNATPGLRSAVGGAGVPLAADVTVLDGGVRT